MNKVLKKQSILPVINIFLIGVLFFITFKYQQYFTLTGHDYFLFQNYLNDFTNTTSRIPGAILMLLFDYLLPLTLNIPRMCYINELYAVIKSVFFFTNLFLFFVRIFYYGSKKELIITTRFFYYHCFIFFIVNF